MENTQQTTLSQDFYFKGPISSLCFLETPATRLIAASGPAITIFDLNTKTELKTIQLFKSCFKIIEVSLQNEGKHIVVHTEKQLIILDANNFEKVYEFMHETNDKIVKAKFEAPHNLVVINAHNFVEKWDLQSNVLIKRQLCEEECILYSADYDKETNNIAGGTVFRSIIIWNTQRDLNQNGLSQVQYRLSGHAGVIFDVKFLNKTKIASVSDDRSLRIWKLNLTNIGDYQQLYEFYGHRSRIWKFKELGFLDMFVTVSEDATCKIWEQECIEESKNQIINRSIETLKGHLGKNIRALDCCDGLIATGGDDGAIKVWNAKQILTKITMKKDSSTIIKNFKIPNIQSNLQEGEEAKKQKETVNQIRSIEILTLDPKNDLNPLVIIGTSKGTIQGVIIQQENEMTPQLLFQDPNQSNISDMLMCQNYFEIGSYYLQYLVFSIGDGEILLFQIKSKDTEFDFKLISRFRISDIKALNVFIFNPKQHDSTVSLDILATNGRSEIIRQMITITNDEISFQERKTFKTTLKTQFICSLLINETQTLVTGDTKGNIFLFDYNSPEEQVQNYQYLKAHKNERVISIYYCENSKQLYSTSKDNQINVYNFTGDKNEIQKITSIKEEDLNIIYQIFKYNQKMILFGFYGNFAYIWNKQENLQIFGVDTKGGNRPIRLRLQGQFKNDIIDEQRYGKSYILAYSYGDCLVICNNWAVINEDINEFSYTLQDSLHGREILTSCGFKINQNKNIILTGGEDSFVKINEFSDNKIHSLHTISNHVASVRSISKLFIKQEGDLREYLVLSVGSRMEANLFKTTYKTQDNHQFAMGHLCHFMRSSEQDEEQDFRIMSSALFEIQGEYYCAFGTSSGEIQFYVVNSAKKRLEDVEKFQLQSSVLSMRRVKVSPNNHIIACGLSNGDIYLFTVTLNSENKAQIQLYGQLSSVHDFGVNCIDTKIYQGNLYVVSGGDDQQISVLLFSKNKNTNQYQISRQTKMYAHSSCVKGLAVFIREEKLLIASSSYDQRYKEWVVEDNGEIVFAENVRTSRHCLSDINGLAKFKDVNGQHKIGIVGQGLAIY